MTGKNSPVSLYFHIPFCTKKCGYCHFYVLPDLEHLKAQLFDSFLLEWEQKLPFLQDKKIVSIYFGGGTPSLFGPGRIEALINLIKKSISLASNIEITLEANPENIDRSLLSSYREAGINRTSIGIQTLDGSLLQLLGRSHTPQRAMEAVYETFAAGIENITIDLMYDLPNQSIAAWEATLDQVKKLPISHLSLYNLTIEPHTQFFKKRQELHPQLPDEKISLEMYRSAIHQLEKAGLMQYEISAFAKPGYHSIHNTGYWTGRPFLGFGPSAFSYWEGRRFRNVSHLGKYTDALKNKREPIDFDEKLDLDAHRRELLVIALRLRKGVVKQEFEQLHGPLPIETMQAMHQLKKEGYLNENSDLWSLTPKGILFYDTLASELI